MSTSTTHERGEWVQTYGGGRLFLDDPRAEDIAIEQIAHPLSRQPRFIGQGTTFYSVAQHACHVADLVHTLALEKGLPERRYALAGLMHDAAEAYIGDIAQPWKNKFPCLVDAEAKIFIAIAAKYDLMLPLPELVHRADQIMFETERRDIMHPPAFEWTVKPRPAPADFTLVPWPILRAYDEFMERFWALTR